MSYICYPNAKINLGLFVTSRRPDGYHNLLSVFYPVESLHDELVIERDEANSGYSFEQKGIVVDAPPADNLVVRAYELMRKEYGIGGVRISLTKCIPFGAGLGGGSADAAFVVKSLNELFSLGLADAQLASLVVRLGADCPFFVYNKPMLAEGIGDVLSPVNLDLSGYRIEVVKPDVSVSTAEAYRGITPMPAPCDPKWVVENEPVERWREYLRNDFEDVVFRLFPQVGELKQDMYARGAVYASMSGSGSAVYGIFRK
ncbi:MAG: 4-(cytidine 5'-diphospho)-2-C-methyl-D-erythritol kinase [Paludibacteraceae bacterium]|nr:4-(cytidine 5'-diphospho)-2-C-methyl-D-erythritol kinase [Paludibacteraceae bacterium]